MRHHPNSMYYCCTINNVSLLYETQQYLYCMSHESSVCLPHAGISSAAQIHGGTASISTVRSDFF